MLCQQARSSQALLRAPVSNNQLLRDHTDNPVLPPHSTHLAHRPTASSPGALLATQRSFRRGGSAAADGPDSYTASDGGFLSLSGRGMRSRGSRSSDGTGASGGDGSSSSTLGLSSSATGAGGSPLAVSLSGMVTAMQRGLSGAGKGMRRALSKSGVAARLSLPGFAGYERLVPSSLQSTQPDFPDGVVPLAAARSPELQQMFEEVELQSTSGFRRSPHTLTEQAAEDGMAQQLSGQQSGVADGFFLPVSVDPNASASLRSASPSQGPLGGRGGVGPARLAPQPVMLSSPPPDGQQWVRPVPTRDSYRAPVTGLEAGGGSSSANGSRVVRGEAGLLVPPPVLPTPAAASQGDQLPRGSRLAVGFSSSSGGTTQGGVLTAPSAVAGAGQSLQSALSGDGSAARRRLGAVQEAGGQAGGPKPLRVVLPPPPRASTVSQSGLRQSGTTSDSQSQQQQPRSSTVGEQYPLQPVEQPDLL